MVTPTATASSSRNPQTPSGDSLAFSAQLYTSRIESWIPANFGTTYQPPNDISLNSNADQDGNLGIGHPNLEIPKYKRQDHGAGQLEKMLGLHKKGKGKAEDGGVVSTQNGKAEEEEEEEESRGSIGKKRKVGAVDLLAGKKKAKAKMKAKTDAVGQKGEVVNTERQDNSSKVLPTIKEIKADRSDTVTPTTSQEPPTSTAPSTIPATSPITTLTKNQRKNLRKKQKKAAENAA
jgi:hypothetical protein